MRGRTAILIIITLAAMPVLALADGSAKAIVRRMVEADQRNWKLARTLEFSERVDSRRLDSEGKLKSKEVTIYDVLLVEGSPYRRLASRNDLALAATDAEKERRKFNQSLFERKRESARQRAMRVTEYESRPEWQWVLTLPIAGVLAFFMALLFKRR